MEIKNTNNSLRDDVRNLLFLYPDKTSLELSFMITVTSYVRPGSINTSVIQEIFNSVDSKVLV